MNDAHALASRLLAQVSESEAAYFAAGYTITLEPDELVQIVKGAVSDPLLALRLFIGAERGHSWSDCEPGTAERNAFDSAMTVFRKLGETP